MSKIFYKGVQHEQITNHKSQITNHKSQITNHKSQITNHKSQITNHKSQTQITNHKSQITNHKSQITNHKSHNGVVYHFSKFFAFCLISFFLFSCGGKKGGGMGGLGLALALGGGGGGGGSSSSSAAPTKPKEGGSGLYPELEKKIKETISFDWNTGGKQILSTQEDYDKANTFSISGNFLQDLNKLVQEKKKVEFGYQVTVDTKKSAEEKIKFISTNQDKVSFTIKASYSSLQPAKAFAKSKVTVTLYIEDKKVYTEEFEGAIVKGTKEPQIFFKDKDGNDLANNKFIVAASDNYAITLSSEKYDGLQTRIEAGSLLLKDATTSNFVPVVNTPTRVQTARDKVIFNFQTDLSKLSVSLPIRSNSPIIKAKLFVRTTDRENWQEAQTSTHYYTIFIENRANIRFHQPLVCAVGDDFSFTFNLPAAFANNKLSNLALQGYDTAADTYTNLMLVIGDTGVIHTSASGLLDPSEVTFRNSIMDSIEFSGNDGKALTTGQDYQITFKNLKVNQKIIFFLRFIGKTGTSEYNLKFYLLVK